MLLISTERKGTGFWGQPQSRAAAWSRMGSGWSRWWGRVIWYRSLLTLGMFHEGRIVLKKRAKVFFTFHSTGMFKKVVWFYFFASTAHRGYFTQPRSNILIISPHYSHLQAADFFPRPLSNWDQRSRTYLGSALSPRKLNRSPLEFPSSLWINVKWPH